MSARGHVAPVGAGPGGPRFLSRKALARLRQADLVLYDALVPAAIVALARKAQRFSVGKRAGRPSFRQETIHSVMIRAARRGRRVVRLKAGDPFVLGRGGEEALALRAAGVDFEVVPGITSAFAAPALAGIPVTHRGLSAGVLVVSGHAESSYRPLLEMLPPESVTVVVLMGLGESAAIASLLVSTGWRSQTPVAVVFAAGTPDAFTWTGTLGTLSTPGSRGGAALSAVASAKAEAPRASGAPATIVIGQVVSLADVIGAVIEEKESHVSHG
jgi:uroporphyrin-III C-methyltransferase/precorrin-2 dehydrogenase/sirohydrochlorin ferrochelatase